MSKAIRFDVLPDDVLLDIFDFHVDSTSFEGAREGTEAWQSLVHVCRRWRSLVFRSPRRLNLRLFWASSSGTDNIIATLGHTNRVCRINLWHLYSQMEEVLAAMQVPFPELTYSSLDETPVIPDSFLGGHFSLEGIPFPGLPKLLLTATNLVSLCLEQIPHSSGTFHPKRRKLSSPLCLTSDHFPLNSNTLKSRPDRQSRSLPPPNRSILPALEDFRFKGVSEYLENFVTIVDAPQLNKFQITFINQIDFDAQRLAQFINRNRTNAMKHTWNSILRASASCSRLMIVFGLSYHAENQIGGFRPSHRSVTPLCLPRLRTSTSTIGDHFGTICMISITPYGCSSYSHLRL
jgi:hypothetical protein